MLKRYKAVLFFILPNLTSLAQINELNVLKNPTASIGISKAREAYNAGEYITAETLLYSELEQGNFTPNDFLLFANTLIIDDKPALAQEFYTEYAIQSGNKNAKALISQIFDDKKPDHDSSKVFSPEPLTNPTYYGNKVYSAINGKMMSFDKDCDENLYNQKEVFQGLTDQLFGSISFYNQGNTAIASLIDSKTNKCGLYIFTQKKGVWKKPVKIMGDQQYNYAFPYVDEKNHILYFS